MCKVPQIPESKVYQLGYHELQDHLEGDSEYDYIIVGAKYP